MDLDTYLNAEGIKGVDFAAQLEISEASLTRIRRGEQNIPRDLIRKIVTMTGGQVTAMALVFSADHDGGSIPGAAGTATGLNGDLSGGVEA